MKTSDIINLIKTENSDQLKLRFAAAGGVPVGDSVLSTLNNIKAVSSKQEYQSTVASVITHYKDESKDLVAYMNSFIKNRKHDVKKLFQVHRIKRKMLRAERQRTYKRWAIQGEMKKLKTFQKKLALYETTISKTEYGRMIYQAARKKGYKINSIEDLDNAMNVLNGIIALRHQVGPKEFKKLTRALRNIDTKSLIKDVKSKEKRIFLKVIEALKKGRNFLLVAPMIPSAMIYETKGILLPFFMVLLKMFSISETETLKLVGISALYLIIMSSFEFLNQLVFPNGQRNKDKERIQKADEMVTSRLELAMPIKEVANSHPFKPGARVLWEDGNGFYNFGVVYETGSTIKIMDDKGEPHSVRFNGSIKNYEGWKTEKKTGEKKSLTATQKKNLKKGENIPKGTKFYTRKTMIPWGLPLARSIYAWANKRYFGRKLYVRGKIFPPLGVTKNMQYRGAYHLRTKRIVVNQAALTTMEQVSACMIHEMIHMYDHMIRKAMKPGYDPHGPWFQSYAKKIEENIGINFIRNIDDNLIKEGITNKQDYQAEVDVDSNVLSIVKPYYLFTLIKKEKAIVGAQIYGARFSKEDKAFDLAERFDESDNNYVGIYKLKISYFEELLPAGGNVKPDNFFRKARKLTEEQLVLIKNHGEALEPYGDVLNWYREKVIKAKAGT